MVDDVRIKVGDRVVVRSDDELRKTYANINIDDYEDLKGLFQYINTIGIVISIVPHLSPKSTEVLLEGNDFFFYESELKLQPKVVLW